MNILKLALNTYLLKREPISLIHFVTHKCNARCKHCFIDFRNEASSDELSISEIERLTKKMGGSLYNVNLTGGEPFLRKDIFEIVSLYCKNTSAEIINITTNGTYTDAVRDLIERFRSAKFKQKLMFSISIDNFEPAHDDNRGVKGIYSNALKTYKLIESYEDRQIVGTISITVTPHNHCTVTGLYRHLRRQGVKSFFPILIREEGAVRNIENKPAILAAWSKLQAQIKADRLEGMGDDPKGIYSKARSDLINKILPEIYLTKRYVCHCSAGTLFGVIRPNGDVLPCEVLDSRNLGNLRDYDMDFMKLWNSEKSGQWRRDLKKNRCSCSFECAWSVNIASNIKFIPRLLFHILENISWKRRR